MAPLLRHPAGDSPTTTSPAAASLSGTFPVRRHATSTLVSHEGLHGDRSFLLIRERPGPVPSGERLVLRGDFGASTRGRLESLLAALPAADKPLLIDLRRVTTLDEGCLSLLLKVQRDHAPRRPVIFQIAEAGPVYGLVRSLGLEKKLGLEKRLGLEEPLVSKTGDGPTVILPGQRPKAVPTAGLILRV